MHLCDLKESPLKIGFSIRFLIIWNFCCLFRFAQSVGLVDQVSARKFLEAAKATENPMIFFTVFRFFEQRNVRLRGNAKFHSGWFNW